MTSYVKTRAVALGWVLADDIAQALGVDTNELGETWQEFAEAMALAVFAETKLDRVAATGVVAYTAARLP